MGKPAENSNFYSIKQVSEITDIPVATIRKYLGKYRNLLGLKRGDNNALAFTKDSIQTLLMVRSLVGQGLPFQAVVDHIKNQRIKPDQTPQEQAGERVSGGLIISERFDTLPMLDMVHGVVKREIELNTALMDQRFQAVSHENKMLRKALEKMQAQILMMDTRQTEQERALEDQSIWDIFRRLFKGKR